MFLTIFCTTLSYGYVKRSYIFLENKQACKISVQEQALIWDNLLF